MFGYCTNPFGPRFAAMNPRMNFYMGLAAITSYPYMPYQFIPFNNALSYGMNANLYLRNTYNNRANTDNANLYPQNNSTQAYVDSLVSSAMANMPKYNLTVQQSIYPNLSLSNSNKKPAEQSQSLEQFQTSQPNITTKESKLSRSNPKYGKAFLAKVKQIAKNLNCNYKDLLAVMNAESDIKSDKWHGNSAVGLIQFTDKATAELKRVYGIDITKEQIAKMDPVDQLDLVEKYLKVTKSYYFSTNAKLSKEDLYAIVFTPGRANREVLATRGEAFYAQNKGLDFNKDGKITKAELGQQINRKYVDDNSFLA